jgi:hypothetical protein
MNSYVVVFRGDPTTGGFPIAITSDSESVRLALESGLREVFLFAQDHRTDPALRAQAKGNIDAIQETLAELESPE